MCEPWMIPSWRPRSRVTTWNHSTPWRPASRSLPWVEDEGAARLEMARIPGDRVEPVPDGRCREESVDGGDDYTGLLRPGGEFPPDPRRIRVDPEDAIAETRLEAVEP